MCEADAGPVSHRGGVVWCHSQYGLNLIFNFLQEAENLITNSGNSRKLFFSFIICLQGKRRERESESNKIMYSFNYIMHCPLII